MNRKVISLLAILAMLCTMFTFEMPSIAEEASSEDTALSSILADIDAGGTELKKLLADADEAAIIAAAELDKSGITWKAFEWDVNDYPRYAFHKVYEAAGYAENDAVKNWSISDPADWEAMRDVADGVNATIGNAGADAPTENGEYVDYFKGVTFHLTGDIEFSKTQMKPMGFSIYKEGGGFAGTLDGHGYGFTDVYVRVVKNDALNPDTEKAYANSCIYTGLFHRLADCTIKDFGLNRGLITTNTGSTQSCISSFGTVISGKTPKFERVWSSAYLYAQSNTRGTALVGTFDNTDITVDLNGFVFDGAMVKGYGAEHSGQFTFGVYGTQGTTMGDDNSFYNIITDYKSCNGSFNTNYVITEKVRGARSALFNFSSVTAYEACDIENVYAVKGKGINDGYFIAGTGYGGSGSEDLLTDMSAAEVAWTINQNPTSLNEDGTGAEPVYFTLNDNGEVRPIPEGEQDGKIIKASITGAITKDLFVNAGSTVDLKTKLGYNDTASLTISEGDGYSVDGSSVTFGTADVTLNLAVDCEHNFSYENNGEQHIGTCSLCGYQIAEDCVAETYTESENTTDAATHSGECKVCETTFTQPCDFALNDGKYVCADCGREADAPAEMVAGDVKGDGKVDLTDAIALLKKLVDESRTINERNADVDGDGGEPAIGDAHKIILFFLKDKKTVDAFEAIEQRVNKANFYNEETIAVGNLKMDGTDGENDRYLVTENIAVGKGNTIVFGPVRPAQPVMGYFYDADVTPMNDGLINHLDINTVHTFAEGMIMASVTVPEGAAYVRLQANAEEEDQFYIRINNDFSIADYQYQTKADADALGNPLKDQFVLTVGDSLCAAGGNADRDPTPDGELGGWPRRIKQQYNASVINSSQGGAGISIVKFLNNTTGETITDRQCIVNQLNMHRDTGRQFEYILLEGGGNDAANATEQYGIVGEVSDSFDPATFDPSTYAGGLELLIYSTIKTHGDTAAIGYMSYYDMPYAAFEGMHTNNRYFTVGKEICKKWGIEYLNLNEDEEFNERFDESKYNKTTNPNAHTYDGIHANDAGYDIMYDYIGPFMQEMRPVSQEIYLEVQKYNEIDKVIGPQK